MCGLAGRHEKLVLTPRHVAGAALRAVEYSFSSLESPGQASLHVGPLHVGPGPGHGEARTTFSAGAASLTQDGGPSRAERTAIRRDPSPDPGHTLRLGT